MLRLITTYSYLGPTSSLLDTTSSSSINANYSIYAKDIFSGYGACFNSNHNIHKIWTIHNTHNIHNIHNNRNIRNIRNIPDIPNIPFRFIGA